MIDTKDTTSTRPYLIRALYEWCTDNSLTPYVAVVVDETVRVPNEYVKDGEIVLNISFDATSALKLGNEYIEFKARFAGTAREIMVPIDRVIAIYARENGQGMSFPMGAIQNSSGGVSPTGPGGLSVSSGTSGSAGAGSSGDAVVGLTAVASKPKGVRASGSPQSDVKVIQLMPSSAGSPVTSASPGSGEAPTGAEPPRPPAGPRPALKRVK